MMGTHGGLGGRFLYLCDVLVMKSLMTTRKKMIKAKVDHNGSSIFD